MKYNNNKSVPANKKSIVIRAVSIVIILLIGAVLFVLLFHYSKQVVQNMSVNELIAVLALLVTLGTVVFKLSEKILEYSFTTKRKLTLDVVTQKNYATITCKIENSSNKRIIPQNIYLMVEEGIQKDSVIEFPYLLKHEEGEFDCVFAGLCKKGGFTCLPEHLIDTEFKQKYRRIIKLRHLSSETIMFIDPGEEFSEDVVLHLESGIYRVTAVWTSVKEDCICGTKQFIIE